LFSLHETSIFVTVYTRIIHWTILCQVPHVLLFKIRFNVITKPKTKSRKKFFIFRAKNFYFVYLSPQACYMTRTSTPSWYSRENIHCAVQIMNLHMFLCSFLTSSHSWTNILKVWDKSSGPHKTTVKIIDLHFTFRKIQFLNEIRIDDNLEPKYGKNSPYLMCI
jgi:hypothetical protein